MLGFSAIIESLQAIMKALLNKQSFPSWFLNIEILLGQSWNSQSLLKYTIQYRLVSCVHLRCLHKWHLLNAHVWGYLVPSMDTGIMCLELPMRTLLKTDNSIWMWQGIAMQGFDLISYSIVTKEVLVSIFPLLWLGNAKDPAKPQNTENVNITVN